MTQTVPSYLKVHRGEASSPSHFSLSSASEQFWQAFSNATGWRLDEQQPRKRPRAAKLKPVAIATQQAAALPVSSAQSASINAPPSPRSGAHPAADSRDHDSNATLRIDRQTAESLAQQAASLTHEIDRLQHVVREQEVELAAHAVRTIAPSKVHSTSENVRDLLGDTLAAGSFDAAALYMLDDETQYLHTRAVFGLPSDRLGAQSRELRGCRADLEAMVQEVVLIDNLHDAAGHTWNAPEQFASAVCVAIKKNDLPIGTLWLFGQQARSLGSREATIGKLAARQIALELATASHHRTQQTLKGSADATRDIAEWQYTGLPAGSHLAPGWKVDGMIESTNDWATGWHHWDVLPDGTLMLAMAQSLQASATGAMVAASAKSAMIAHLGYRHTPSEILQRINDTLWQSSSAEQVVSMIYLRVSPETGEGQVALAGDINSLIVGPYGYRPLVGQSSCPLGQSIDVDCVESTFHLGNNECLLTFSDGLPSDGISQETVGCALRAALLAKDNPLASLRRKIASFPLRNERGLMSLTRKTDR